jgi:hypothetical protein
MAKKSVISMFFQWSKYQKIYSILSPLIAVKTFIYLFHLAPMPITHAQFMHLPNLHIVILHFSQLRYEN